MYCSASKFLIVTFNKIFISTLPMIIKTVYLRQKFLKPMTFYRHCMTLKKMTVTGLLRGNKRLLYACILCVFLYQFSKIGLHLVGYFDYLFIIILYKTKTQFLNKFTRLFLKFCLQ